MKNSGVPSPFQGGQQIESLLKRLSIIGLFLLLAIFVGYLVGGEQFVLIAWIVGIFVLLVVTMGMQRRAWVLILLGWAMIGQVGILPLPLTVRDLTIMSATSAYITYRTLSRPTIFAGHGFLNVLVALNLGWFLATDIIHPAGFSSLGGETSGGRTYVEVVFAALAYWLLLRMPESAVTTSRIPYFLLASATFVTGLNVLGYIFPGVLPYVYKLYNQFDWEVYFYGGERLKGLRVFGMAMIPLLCAYYRPGSLFNPLRLRFYFLLLGLLSILASGFRSVLVQEVVIIALAALLHRNWLGIVLPSFLGILLIAGLAMGQGRFYRLPDGVQRTLSFLPGDWSPEVVAEAEESATWRFELWQTVIRDKAIKNWWVGDGLSLRMQDVIGARRMEDSSTGSALVTGYYHNGPLTAIRFAGVIGLALFYCLMISGVVYSLRCVRQCRGTLLFPASVFVATQLIWYPVNYTFVFGSYDGDIVEVTFLVALLGILIRMAPQAHVLAENPLPRQSPAPQPPLVAKTIQ